MSIYKVWIELQEYDDNGEDATGEPSHYYGPFAFETRDQADAFATGLERINPIDQPGFLPSYSHILPDILPAFWEESLQGQSQAAPPPPDFNHFL